jgi:DDE domain
MANRSRRVDETYLRVTGEWTYLYRAVDSTGDTIDFLLSAKRDAQDHRAIKRRVRAMQGFRSFHSAWQTSGNRDDEHDPQRTGKVVTEGRRRRAGHVHRSSARSQPERITFTRLRNIALPRCSLQHIPDVNHVESCAVLVTHDTIQNCCGGRSANGSPIPSAARASVRGWILCACRAGAHSN